MCVGGEDSREEGGEEKASIVKGSREVGVSHGDEWGEINSDLWRGVRRKGL